LRLRGKKAPKALSNNTGLKNHKTFFSSVNKAFVCLSVFVPLWQKAPKAHTHITATISQVALLSRARIYIEDDSD